MAFGIIAQRRTLGRMGDPSCSPKRRLGREAAIPMRLRKHLLPTVELRGQVTKKA
jgi:hypothetical protein